MNRGWLLSKDENGTLWLITGGGVTLQHPSLVRSVPPETNVGEMRGHFVFPYSFLVKGNVSNLTRSLHDESPDRTGGITDSFRCRQPCFVFENWQNNFGLEELVVGDPLKRPNYQPGVSTLCPSPLSGTTENFGRYAERKRYLGKVEKGPKQGVRRVSTGSSLKKIRDNVVLVDPLKPFCTSDSRWTWLTWS